MTRFRIRSSPEEREQENIGTLPVERQLGGEGEMFKPGGSRGILLKSTKLNNTASWCEPRVYSIQIACGWLAQGIVVLPATVNGFPAPHVPQRPLVPVHRAFNCAEIIVDVRGGSGKGGSHSLCSQYCDQYMCYVVCIPTGALPAPISQAVMTGQTKRIALGVLYAVGVWMLCMEVHVWGNFTWQLKATGTLVA